MIQSKAFLQTAASLAPHMYEPHFNLSILSEKVIYYYFNSSEHLKSAVVKETTYNLYDTVCQSDVFVCVQIGDLQSSYTAAQKSEDSFPEHVDTQQLLKQLRQHFAVLWASDQQA